MAKEARTRAAEQPDDLYDSLDETSRSVWDLIGSMGYRPDRDEKTLRWYALAINGDKKIGPKPTLSDLAEAVQEAQPKDSPHKVTKLKADSKGNTYFEGMEPIVDQEVATAAGAYHALKTEHGDATRRLVAAKDDLAEVCHRKSHLFKVDPDNTKEKIYKIGDLVIRIANEVREKITTEILTEEI